MTNLVTFPASKRGKFFAIDRRSWAHACNSGINSMTAYLVLARGTGHDQRTTSWSINAIETYTGIGRPRAQKAIEALVQAGLVQIIHRGTRPRYCLVPAHDVPGCEGYPPPKLSDDEQKLVDQLAAGTTLVQAKGGRGWPGYRNPRAVAADLAKKGRVRPVGDQWPYHYYVVAYDAEAAAKPDWIWLPNAIVDGASGETAPVELVRQTQNAATLRLLIELYHSQNLTSDGGLHWRSIRQTFTRHMVGQQGPFTVYGFERGTFAAWPNKPFVRPHITGSTDDERKEAWQKVFWNAWHHLVQLGLVELVGHLVEADNDTADIIHPYAVGNGEPAERKVANAAHEAGMAMLTKTQQDGVESRGLHLAPVRVHITEVQMVGIARLRYRPQTSATAAWLAKTIEWDKWTARYSEIGAEARGESVLADMQHQGISR